MSARFFANAIRQHFFVIPHFSRICGQPDLKAKNAVSRNMLTFGTVEPPKNVTFRFSAKKGLKNIRIYTIMMLFTGLAASHRF